MNRYKLGVTTASLVLTLTLAAGCGGRNKDEEGGIEETTAADAPSSAESPSPGGTGHAAGHTMTVTLQGAPGDTDFAGTLTVAPEGTGVRVVADVAGVDEDGRHGIHVHENGQCDHGAAGGQHFASSGGHFNPTGTEHACPPTEPRHAGDLGNIEVQGGRGHLELLLNNVSADSLHGKAVILHTGEDDCKTQPTGNSGDRLACGVIGGDMTHDMTGATATPGNAGDTGDSSVNRPEGQ